VRIAFGAESEDVSTQIAKFVIECEVKLGKRSLPKWVHARQTHH